MLRHASLSCRLVRGAPVGSRERWTVTLTALVVVVLAVTAALVYNRVVWRPRQASGRVSHDGQSIAGIIGPLGTLSVFLLVFVLVQTYASWLAARQAETPSATATLLRISAIS